MWCNEVFNSVCARTLKSCVQVYYIAIVDLFASSCPPHTYVGCRDDCSNLTFCREKGEWTDRKTYCLAPLQERADPSPALTRVSRLFSCLLPLITVFVRSHVVDRSRLFRVPGPLTRLFVGIGRGPVGVETPGAARVIDETRETQGADPPFVRGTLLTRPADPGPYPRLAQTCGALGSSILYHILI